MMSSSHGTTSAEAIMVNPSQEGSDGSCIKDKPWRESQFQDFFKKNPFIPVKGKSTESEKLCVIAVEKPFQRVADIICLDEKGVIVIIEVKNEKAARAAVGQSLEYLSQFDGLSLEEFNSEFFESTMIPNMFRDCFGKEIDRLLNQRRVIIIAPKFGLRTRLGVKHLNRILPEEISFELIEVVEDVTISNIKEKKFDLFFSRNIKDRMNSRAIVGRFGKTIKSLNYILEGGDSSLRWTVGSSDFSGRLGCLDDTNYRVGNRPSIRKGSILIVPLEDAPNCVDMSWHNTVWTSKSKSGVVAQILGSVKCNGTSYVSFAKFSKKTNKWKFETKQGDEFEKAWERIQEPAKRWAEIHSASNLNPNKK